MGINYGTKYTYSFNAKEAQKEKEGVFFGKKSQKWLVKVKNETKSKYARPFITVAQFTSKKAAQALYRELQDNT